MPAAVSDGDADSRLFVVCGKHVEVGSTLQRQSACPDGPMPLHEPLEPPAVQQIAMSQEDVLVDAFQPFGIVQSIKIVRDKGGETPDPFLHCHA